MTVTGRISTHECEADSVVEWRIAHFSTFDERDDARYYSPIFSFLGERWYFEIYPNGASVSGTPGHADLLLWKYSSGRNTRVTFSLSLKTAKGKKYKEEHVTKNFHDYNGFHTFNRFIPRAELTSRRSELLPDDVLTVVCSMKKSTSDGNKTHSASAEISTPISDSAVCSSGSGECRYCKGSFAAGILSSHQRKCDQRPVKCPDCSEVVVLQKFLNEHECRQRRPGDYNCREKLLMALCIASIIIAVVTACALSFSTTPLTSSHPGREAVTKIETSEINNTINGSELDGSLSNEIGDIDIKQTEGVNKAAEVTLTTELNAELNKTNQSEIAKSVTPEASVANQADSAETGVSEGASKIQTSINNRSDAVGSNGFEALTSNETSSTDIKKDEGINKTLAVEINETDKSEIAASDISETFATNQADSAENDESDHNLPKDREKQLVLYAATIIILVIAIACVHHYSKTSLSATHAYGEDNLEQNSENTSMVVYTQMAEENEERDWMTDVLDFLKAGNCIDVTFEVETPNGHLEFFAHKLILAMKSPFFADEFYGERKSDSHLVIPLKGINPRAFMEMLRYCYDNKPRMRTIEEACVLFKVASDFKILNLQKLCHTFIKDAKIDP